MKLFATSYIDRMNLVDPDVTTVAIDDVANMEDFNDLLPDFLQLHNDNNNDNANFSFGWSFVHHRS